MCKITVITGHYGAGKTNLAVNMALSLKQSGKSVAIADLDIVNPYFRTAEFKELFDSYGISLKVSDLAGGSLDVPAINLDIKAEVNNTEHLIIDVGGDPEGAKVLGRFASEIRRHKYEMLYVINYYRYLTETPEQAVAIMRGIESKTGLNCTALFNNSHLGKETTDEIVAESVPFAKAVSEITGLPLLEFPVKVYVKPIWDVS